MAEQKICPDCGALLPSGASGAFCPGCLFLLGRDDESTFGSETTVVSSPVQPQHCALPPAAVAFNASATPANPDAPSRFGDFELLSEGLEGGMGVVFRARQISLDRIVGLKMIRAGKLATAQEVQRFRTEAETAAGLDHPHIVSIYEVGEEQGRHYFTMKWIQGQSLADAITDSPGAFPNSPAAAARLMAKVA